MKKIRRTNKILAFGIILCMLFSLLVVPVGASIDITDNNYRGTVKYGDINNDGNIDDTDLQMLAEIGVQTINESSLDSRTKKACDLNLDDDAAGIADIAMLAAYVGGDLATLVNVASGFCGDNVSWLLKGTGELIISGTGDMNNYISPPYRDYKNLIRTVIIEDGVTAIGLGAFYDFRSIEEVVISNSVTVIGIESFEYCSSLITITIPGNVTSIGSQAFQRCDSLAYITIENGVTSIGSSAFYGCSSLTSVTIPDSVTSIGKNAFGYCSSLTSVNITDLEAWCDIDFGDVTSNPLYHAHNLYLNGQFLTDMEVPYGITAVKNCAFSGCNLTSVAIPNSVTSIGKNAFEDCSNLTSVSISDSVTSIGNHAFDDCSSLTSITIPDGVTKISSYTFSGCSNLTSVTIPDDVTSISNNAFEDCSNLSSISFPDSVTSIGNSAFSGCESLTDVYYGGGETDWNGISTGSTNTRLTNANRHYYYTYGLSEPLDYAGKTHYLPKGCTLITTDDLYFRNGYIQSDGGIIKAGNREITGKRIYFTNDGKMHLDADYTAKVERDNGDGTTSQGFMVGMNKPSGIITVNLKVTGTANDVDYTGRTISKEFDFTNYDINGLVNFGFTVNNIPKPLELYIESIE